MSTQSDLQAIKNSADNLTDAVQNLLRSLPAPGQAITQTEPPEIVPQSIVDELDASTQSINDYLAT